MIGSVEIARRFGYQRPVDAEATINRGEIRVRFREFAIFLDDMLSDSREKTLMFDAIEEASMWAYKAANVISGPPWKYGDRE